MPLGMNLATILLCVTTFAAHAEATPAQIFGRGRSVPEDSAENDTMEKLMAGARHISPPTGRRLSSPLDKLEVMIKSVDCFACMEAPPASLNPVRKMLRTDDSRELGHRDHDVFVTALNCDSTDPYQIWNLRSLEPTGTWYLFESSETGECMQLVGDCNPDGTLYDIEMGPCDCTNFKAFWAFTGVGEIVNFECSRSNWESETYVHSTPDIFLEAECSPKGGIDYLDMSSHSSLSKDMAENYWVLYPKSFGSIPAPPCFNIANKKNSLKARSRNYQHHGRVGLAKPNIGRRLSGSPIESSIIVRLEKAIDSITQPPQVPEIPTFGSFYLSPSSVQMEN